MGLEVFRAWALPIDKNVLGKVHKYTEVDRTTVHYSRHAELEDCWFCAQYRADGTALVPDPSH